MAFGTTRSCCPGVLANWQGLLLPSSAVFNHRPARGARRCRNGRYS